MPQLTARIYRRVFHISTENSTGTCFSYENDTDQYCITAKHVLDDLNFENGSDINVSIYFDDDWKEVNATVYLHENEDIDLAVLKLNDFSLHTPDGITYGENQSVLGHDYYFMGFPYGMLSPDRGTVNFKYPIPFVKKGILSIVIPDNDITYLYLDAHNNKGFSGGPVFRLNEDNTVIITGVNLAYIPQSNDLEIEEFDEDGDTYDSVLEYQENSGIMKVISFKHVMEIINAIEAD